MASTAPTCAKFNRGELRPTLLTRLDIQEATGAEALA